MSDIEKQLKESLGIVAWLTVKNIIRHVEITLDAEDRTLTIYRDNAEPVVITFAAIEDYINNVH